MEEQGNTGEEIIVGNGDAPNLESMRELSIESPPSKGEKGANKSDGNRVHAEKASKRSEETEEVLSDGGEGDRGRRGSDPVQEEAALGDPGGDEDADGEVSEDTGGAGEGEERDGSGLLKDSEYLTAKNGDKSYKVPKDAKFQVKVNGKMEEVTASELIKRASGGIHLERELSNLGRERKAFGEKQRQFEEKAARVNRNVQMLINCEDPRDFVEYYSMLKGEEPAKVWNGMVDNVVKFLERSQNMTEREIALEQENRRFKMQGKLRDAEAQDLQRKQAFENDRSQVNKELEEAGLTHADFMAALDEMQEKLNKGQPLGDGFDEIEKLTPFDIVDYAVNMNFSKRVADAISSVSPRLIDDEKFVATVAKAISKTESLHGPMSKAEATKFVKMAAAKIAKGFSESLSKKEERAKRSLKSKSERADSQEQDDDVASLQDHWERLNR